MKSDFFIICEIDQSMTPNQKYSPKPGSTDHLTWSTSTMVQDPYIVLVWKGLQGSPERI